MLEEHSLYALFTCIETLALKGIIVFSNKNNDKEGEPLLKKGLELDPDSHIAWHVYGIFLRTMKYVTLSHPPCYS